MHVDIGIEMREKYLGRRKDDLQTMRKALISGDLETLARIGHQVKGNGSTFGFPELSDVAVRIERASLSQNFDEVKLAVDEFGGLIGELSKFKEDLRN